MLQNLRCLHNVAGVAESFKVLCITETLKNIAEVAGVAEFQNVAGVAVLLKCDKCCSVLKKCGKCCKVFKRKILAGAAGPFECCGDVNKRCKCERFPKT